MTQEKKAKAYDEAIKVIKDNLDALNEITETGVNIVNIQSIRNCFYKAFPELKESEDERIRKALKEYFINSFKNNGVAAICGVHIKDVLAWLEKQGERHPKFRIGDTIKKESTCDIVAISEIDLKNREYRLSNTGFIPFKYEYLWELVEQKPADKVEPKFKVGDWITNGYVGGQITSIEDNYPCYKIADFMGGINTSIPFTLQDNYHLWSIKDAKDGDVLACWIDGDEFVLIYKGVKDGYITTYGHLYQKLKLFAEEPTTMFCRTIQGHFTPATKEQRELLFQKMKESGYEWNADDKKLIKVEQNTDSGSCSLDEDMIKSICEGLQDVFDEFGWSDFGNTPIHDIIDWLKKIKQRIG